MTWDHSEDRVLVGAPTYIGMDYALDRYIAAYDAFVWPERGLMLVDNTKDGGEYARSITDKVQAGDPRRHMRHIEPSPTWEETFKRSWDNLVTHAHFNGYKWILSLETDVIIPALGLDALLNIAGFCNSPFVTHLYPYHHGRPVMYEGLGCVLMHVEFAQYALETQYQRTPTVEGSIYMSANRTTRITLRDYFRIEHLDPPPGSAKPWQYEDETLTSEIGIQIESR